MNLKSMLGCLLLAVSSVVAAEQTAEEVIRSRLIQAAPDLTVEAIEPGLMPGTYQVHTGNAGILNVSEDGRYLFTGDVFRIGENEFTNLSENIRQEERTGLLASIPDDEMIIFAPEKPIGEITVFTDVDCGYCRKLHQEVPELNRLGIQVNYLAYPRAGVGSASYDKMVSAWCAKDQQSAMTDLKNGKKIADRTCENPVSGQMELARLMGVNGTPAIILEDGQLVPGYRPANVLAHLVTVQ